jgi:hypothetical protein
MKVSLYVREHSSRKYRKASKNEPMGTTYVLRYGSTWETITATTAIEARIAMYNKKIEVAQGWKPQPKVKVAKSTVLMLDAAIDGYLCEIKAGRKKKTHQAYRVALKYLTYTQQAVWHCLTVTTERKNLAREPSRWSLKQNCRSRLF